MNINVNSRQSADFEGPAQTITLLSLRICNALFSPFKLTLGDVQPQAERCWQRHPALLAWELNADARNFFAKVAEARMSMTIRRLTMACQNVIEMKGFVGSAPQNNSAIPPRRGIYSVGYALPMSSGGKVDQTVLLPMAAQLISARRGNDRYLQSPRRANNRSTQMPTKLQPQLG